MSANSSSSDDEPSIPSWVFDLKALVKLSVTVGGTSYVLLDEPILFLQAVVIDFVISGAFDLLSFLLGGVLEIFGIIGGAFADAGVAVLEALGPVGDVLLIPIEILGDVLGSIASIGGPAGLVIVIGVFVVMGWVLSRGIDVVTGFLPWT